MATVDLEESASGLPINDLHGVVKVTTSLLDKVTGAWSELLFARANRLPARRAWQELKPRMDELHFQIDQPLVTDYNNAETAGLTGMQLRFKLKVLSDKWRRFREQGNVKLLASLLGTLKTIIESLAKFIPIAEALKELIEFVERILTGADPVATILDAA